MSDYIRILEVEDTNLIYVISNRNTSAVYYHKENVEVSGFGGNVVLSDKGIEVLNNSPADFVDPKEASLKDLVEIIQGYLNNLLPIEDKTVIALEEIILQNETRNELLNSIRRNTKCSEQIIELMIVQNELIREMF